VRAEIVAILDAANEKRPGEQWKALARPSRLGRGETNLAAFPKPQMVYAAATDFETIGSFKPPLGPRQVHMLKRGDVLKPEAPAAPGALSCVKGPATLSVRDPADEGQRRAALARWLTDRDNGLVWRSIVNRVWHYPFGRGIVNPPNDFGRMGSPPSHPELLDWLAVRFRDGGGSLKDLHRWIVTSDTYRQ